VDSESWFQLKNGEERKERGWFCLGSTSQLPDKYSGEGSDQSSQSKVGSYDAELVDRHQDPADRGKELVTPHLSTSLPVPRPNIEVSFEDIRTEHIRRITIKGDRHNNKMERFNGEVRDREKVMRGLKQEDTPILTGYQILHNCLRPHEAVEGKIPTEVCGIKVKGENKWLTIIQNATKRGEI